MELFYECFRSIILISVSLIYGLSKSPDYHDFMCPVHPQWSTRANFICNKTDQYYCLFDENKPGFIEFCRENPWYYSADILSGFKIHYVGDLHRVPCGQDMEDRYQPFKFWTNGSERCRFQKSYCHEEGQDIADNGTEKSDRLCRCDYTRSYDYIVKPKDPCLCNPSKEDCSCYIKSCGTGYILTPEYRCVLTTDWKEKYKCPLILDDEKNIETCLPLGELPEKKTEPRSILPVVISIVGLMTTGALLLFSYMKKLEFISRRKADKLNILTEQINFKPEQKPICLTGTLRSEQFHIPVLDQETIPKNVLEFQRYEKEKWKEKLQNYVETNACKQILKTIKMEHCVIITGPSGCGKTCLAFFTAFRLEETDGYEVLILTDPHDIIKYASADKRQLFILDNVFGNFSINENDMIWWSRQGSVIRQLLSRNKYMKLIMTCKSHIYNSINVDQLYIPFEICNLITNSLQLTSDERRRIAKSYISDDGINQVSDAILMLFSFLPSLCAKFSNEPLLRYFSTPYEIINEELENFRKSSEVNYLALVLLVIKNNNVKRDFFREDYSEEDKLINDLSKDIGSATYPSKPKLLASLIALKGSYTTETELGLQFMSDKLFNIVAYCTSRYCIESMLKYAESSFLKNRLLFEFLNAECPDLTICLPSHLEKAYFERLLRDLKEGLNSNVFTDMQNEIPEFRKCFLGFLEKRLKPVDLRNGIDGSTVLHIVSAQGYEDYVSFFIDLNNDLVNQDDYQGNFPLHYASFRGMSNVIKLLIDKNASIDKANNDGKTPLDIVCKRGHVKPVQILLSNKASIEQRIPGQTTAVHSACENGSIDIIEILLAFNAKLNLTDKNRRTPLHIAALKGNNTLIELLLKQDDIEVNCFDNDHKTPLLIVCQNNNMTGAELLIKEAADPNIPDLEGRLPLHYACQSNLQKLTKVLIKIGSEVNKIDKKKNAPLHLAVLKGHTEVTKLLINSGAKINLCGSFKRTPLILACQTANIILTKFFIENEVKLNKIDESGKSALHYALENKMSEIAKYLIKLGADINIMDMNKNTPFHIACKNGLLDEVQDMVFDVKDINKQNTDNLTPLMLSCREGHREIAFHLIKNGASVSSMHETTTNCLIEACRRNDKDTAEILIKHGALVNQTIKHGITPLIACCEYGNTDLAAFLISKNADINRKNDDGLTPFYIACREGCIDIMKCLYESGVDINEADKDGWSPLYVACEENKKDIVDLLLHFKANVNKSCNKGMSPLQIAIQKGHSDIVDLMKQYGQK